MGYRTPFFAYDKSPILVEVGRCEAAIQKLGKADPNLVPFAVPLDLLLTRVRQGANEVGLELPDRFTVGAPNSVAFKKWFYSQKAEVECRWPLNIFP
jgi:hypothetical protein